VPFSIVKGVIWDLDNTLYRFDSVFEDACNRAAARTICTLVDGLSFDDAFKVAETSYAQHGYSGKALITQYGIDYRDYHFSFHEEIDEKILTRNDAMLQALADLNKPQVIVTNASRHWVEKALAHLGLRDFFTDENIIALGDSDFEPKAYSRRPFDMARNRLSLPIENIIVVEDMAKNLKVPKEMGFTTALIHHGRTPVEQYDYIDLEFPDTLSLLEKLNA
jgi:putative hydrolase of the HAD superfamily